MTKQVRFLRSLIWSRLSHSVPLNEILHWLATIDNSDADANYVISYDFYNVGDEASIIPFPDIQQYQGTRRFKRTITTSAGSVVYCNAFGDNNNVVERTVRVWRLVSTHEHPNSWQLLWQVMTSDKDGVEYFPMVMHPLNSHIMYCWSCNTNSLLLFNLRESKCSLHKEVKRTYKSMDGCIMRISDCKEYMDSISPKLVNNMYASNHHLFFSQFVLPRWFNPLPQLIS
ncbi:putative F-box protein At3g23950 [Capsella rubella]|uniref:putative F-box protein At3g23950 n=1 Tax=Capsella rubella TaxID=81985 RepID=UPI000CD58864|nr:putative F-box protein At3g23950 [Capsella rubella]